MSQPLPELEATFAQAATVEQQRDVVQQVRATWVHIQGRYRKALTGVWIGISVTVAAVVLAAFFGGQHKVGLIIVPAILFGLLVFAAAGLALAKWIHGYRYSRVIALQENAIQLAHGRGLT